MQISTLFYQAGNAGYAGLKVRLNADNGDALRRAALESLGVVYLPTFITGDDIRSGRLVPLLTEFTGAAVDLYAVYPESRHLSPKVRALIDWLLDEVSPEPDWDRELPIASA